MAEKWMVFLLFFALSNLSPGFSILSCPSGCSCFPGYLVCLSSQQNPRSQMPETIPPNVTHIYLDRNQISVIEHRDFMMPENSSKDLRYLSITHNTIMEIQQDAFQPLVNLETLHLQRNKLTRIDRSTFKGLSKLKELNLRDNLLLRIACGAFLGMHNLKSLNLALNKLTGIQNCTFNGLSKLSELDLSNNIVTHVESNAFKNMRVLNHLKLYNNHISKIRFTWFTGKNLTRVQLLGNPWLCSCTMIREYTIAKTLLTRSSCSNIDNMCIICYKPYELQSRPINSVNLTNWKQCKSLWRQSSPVVCNSQNTNCKLTGSENETVHFWRRNLPQTVQLLNITKNDIPVITKSIFNNLQDLVHLQLVSNNIVTIEEYSFTNNHKLEVMDLHDNNITNIQRNIFHGLTSLVQLSLQENAISGTLENRTFELLPSLSSLNLGSNLIQEIKDCAFCNATSLTELFLQNNIITFIHPNAFMGVRKLQTLNIANNQITFLGFKRFVDMTFLNIFNLSNNPWNCTCQMKKQLQVLLQGIKKSATCKDNNLCIRCFTPKSLHNTNLLDLEQTLDCNVTKMRPTRSRSPLLSTTVSNGMASLQNKTSISMMTVLLSSIFFTIYIG